MMKNTGKVFFGEDVPQWYVAQGESWQGPLTAADVYQKVLNQEITWAHFVWKPGQAGWERICDIKTFQGAVPPVPTKGLKEEVKEAVKEAAKPLVRQAKGVPPFVSREKDLVKSWFLHHQDSQYGPYSVAEIGRFVQSGKVVPGVFAWEDGMENWEKVEKISVFGPFFAEKTAATQRKIPPPAPASATRRRSGSGPKPRSELRNTPRRPLVAKIMMSKGDQLVTAICQDISIGGLQVLTDRVPGPVGTHIKMNVSAVIKKGSRTKIEPFVAEGVIVRILEDGQGFSFRFEKLTESAKKAIEAYIHATV